ncbi:hypothetical protein GKQ23_12495 [Erwinia sp. E602]|uniref:hypothetical protein n=1 Tax=unclassified Erwinia TaxID=2622719 RepID=UPI0006F36532|nr:MULTISPECIES: hypothetical protein [unclassified Erwinia]KQN55730.1 hypothetical protein ASF13_09600 [Erwinia sp. Leaf53]PLV60971.1 hypothetical protein NV64_11290 [Erwinia sp. B116]QUG75762.1 hypothetical protein GKQ23_12495 [Erwinia sp. E602]
MAEKKLAGADYGDRICLNYIDFLSASCRKRWSFVDAIYGVMPIFGMVTKKPAAVAPAGPEEIKELALQILSTQVSDEINIARLIALAEQQQLSRFDILLPYPLSASQLDTVRQEYARPLELQQLDDRLQVTLASQTH